MLPRIAQAPQAKFLLLGACNSNNPNAITKAQIDTWQQQGYITYLGVSQDVRPFLESSSCVVLPSSYKEGVPRVLLEAMSMGKPIITTNIAGCRECIPSPHTAILHKGQNLLLGANGILIPPHNVNALVAAMDYLLTHTHIANIFGIQGRKQACKLFAMPRIVEIYSNTAKFFASSFSTNPNSTSLINPPHSQTHLATKQNKPQQPIIACISNTAFAMYNFRLQPLLALQKQGFSIHIIAPFDTNTPALEAAGFICHDLNIDSKSLNPFQDLRTSKQLFTLLRQLKPSLIFTYTIKPTIYGSFVSRILGIPTIAVITGLGYIFIGNTLRKNLLRFAVCKMYKIALKRTKEVWFLNPDDKGEFVARGLVQAEQAKLLPSEGVDTEYFSPQNTANNKSDFTFLLVARMLWDKGVGEFVEAAKILQESMQESLREANKIDSNGGGGINKPLPTFALTIRFQLLGASDCNNPSAISKEQILAWEKQGIIEYLGSTDDVRPFVESSSCVVLPSYREGAPMVLLEAMSMGKPIITTDVSGCREIFTHANNLAGKVGMICESKNANSLAQSMKSMIMLSQNDRSQMGQSARIFTTTYHDRSIIAKLYTAKALELAQTQERR